MHLNPRDRLNARKDLADTRIDSRLCYVCVPVFVRDDFDVDTQSANDPSVSDGLGERVGKWKIYALRAHFRNVDVSLMTYGHVPPGVELGDALVNFGPRDLAAVRQAMSSKGAYVDIDGDRFILISILPTGLGQIEEWSFDARKYSPEFIAPGH